MRYFIKGGKEIYKQLLVLLIIFIVVHLLVYPCSTQLEENSNHSPIAPKDSYDHPWPQQGFNKSHVGRSPYSTEGNPGVEKWRFPASDWCDGSPVIGDDGVVYFGDSDSILYAVNSDGTLKWKFQGAQGFGDFGGHPAIAEDGTIYVGSEYGSYIYAVNPDGTEKWKVWVPEIDTSVTLDDDGVLYYGHRGGGVDARYPNGTLKWRFSTGGCVQSTPAIGDDGVVYFGAHDDYIYAVYPNGRLKWRYLTGGNVHGSPMIGADGMVYCGSDDDYLYALCSENGSLKWKIKIVGSMRSSPSQDKEGNLYFGTTSGRVICVASIGVINWQFVIGNDGGVWGSTAAVSDDGTVYIGSHIDFGMLGGGEIIALDTEGTLLWRKTLCNSVLRSSPVIGSDGSVYICASNDGSPDAWGYLHAFGMVENNGPPDIPVITGPAEVDAETSYKFRFRAHDSDKTPVSYFIDWGDGTTEGWTRDYEPGLSVPVYHKWMEKGTYVIRAKARDTFGLETSWSEPFQVTVGGPDIRILDIKGGFSVRSVIRNWEDHVLYNVKWSICFNIDFGSIVYPLDSCKDGRIFVLGVEKTRTIRACVLGAAMGTITVTAGENTKTVDALILGPFVLIFNW
jgi:outer membrane protein assembly factor BamB